MAGNVPSWQNLGPRFSNGSLHENLGAARHIDCAPFLSPREIVKHSKQKRTQLVYGHTSYSKSIDQPGKVASSARGQLNRENECMAVTAMQL